MPEPRIQVSWGECVDKLTILAIKERRLTSAAALANVRRELAALNTAIGALPADEGFLALKNELAAINEALWDIEDKIRSKEAQQSFDAEFVALARAVYHNNDRRALIKRRINHLLGSETIEEKQYASYPGQRDER